MDQEELKRLRADDENAYFDYLAKAGTDLNSFLENETRLNRDLAFKPSYIAVSKAVQVFYALIYLEGKVKEHTRDKSQIRSFQTLYNSKFADCLFDYLVGAIAGELRHTSTCISGKRVMLKPSGILKNGSGRSTAISKAIELSPKYLLETAIQVYGLSGWSGAYGGANWKNIAETTAKISSLSKLRWIDEVIHCRHCGGRLFDRPIIFHHEDTYPYRQLKGFRTFLDYRREGGFDKDLDDSNYTFSDLLHEYEEVIEQILNYKPVVFGHIKLTHVIEQAQVKSPKTVSETTVNKTNKNQKVINSKPFILKPCAIAGLNKVLVYVSDKFKDDIQTSLIDSLGACYETGYIPATKVYILWTYKSKGKQYIRKCTFTSGGKNGFVYGSLTVIRKKLQQKLGHIVMHTNNTSNIKIYFDKI